VVVSGVVEIAIIEAGRYQLPLVLIDRRCEVLLDGADMLAIGQLRIGLGGPAPDSIATRAFHTAGDQADVMRLAFVFRQPEAVYNRLADFGQIAENLRRVDGAIDFELARQACRQNLARCQRMAEHEALAPSWLYQTLRMGYTRHVNLLTGG
jgi:hypothetical protein